MWLCLIFPAICLHSYGQEESVAVLDSAYKWYPRYVTFLPQEKIDSVLQYADTDLVPVIFKVNRHDRLAPTPQLDSITALIDSISNDKRTHLAYVWIGGSASPEGPLWWNKRLGHYRSSRLAEYIRANTSVNDSLIRVENLEEDWRSVLRSLDKIDFPNKDAVIAIIKSEPDREKRKEKLKALDNGATWKRLVREVFPPFRNARMVIVCNADLTYVPRQLVPLKLAPPLPAITVPGPPPIPTLAALPQPPAPDDRFIALKTNALFLAALTANIGFEAELWPRWSIDIPVWYSPYDITPTRRLRLLAIQPEVRFWPSKAGEGHFFGLHTHVVGFDVSINDNGRYQDPNHALWGMGLSYGYVINIGKEKRWAVEFNIGVGYAEYDYDVYRNWKNGLKFKSGSDSYWGITRAGISIAYKWHHKRRTKGGIL